MTDRSVRFSATLHRIEVHAGPISPDKGDDFRWALWAQPGQGDSVVLWGYMRRSTAGGLGQAQSVGILLERDWEAINASKAARAEFSDWVDAYAAEILWDTARRALQAQAALMDFQFDLDVQAPTTELAFQFPDLAGSTSDQSR